MTEDLHRYSTSLFTLTELYQIIFSSWVEKHNFCLFFLTEDVSVIQKIKLSEHDSEINEYDGER